MNLELRTFYLVTDDLTKGKSGQSRNLTARNHVISQHEFNIKNFPSLLKLLDNIDGENDGIQPSLFFCFHLF